MQHIIYKNQKVELSNRLFYYSLLDVISSIFQTYQIFFAFQTRGFPDTEQDKYSPILSQGLDWLAIFETQITDKKVVDSINQFKADLNRFNESQILLIKLTQNSISKKKKELYLKDHTPPIFVDEQPYRKYLLESSKNMNLIISDIEKILKGVNKLIKMQGGPLTTDKNTQELQEDMSKLKKYIDEGIKHGFSGLDNRSNKTLKL